MNQEAETVFPNGKFQPIVYKLLTEEDFDKRFSIVYHAEENSYTLFDREVSPSFEDEWVSSSLKVIKNVMRLRSSIDKTSSAMVFRIEKELNKIFFENPDFLLEEKSSMRIQCFKILESIMKKDRGLQSILGPRTASSFHESLLRMIESLGITETDKNSDRYGL